MGVFLRLADLLGFMDKVRVWMQGKKTYLANIFIVISALGVLLACGSDAIKVLMLILSEIGKFTDGESAAQAQAAIMLIASQHAGVLVALGAAWAGFLQACSNLARYAQQVRAHQETLVAIAAQPAIACPPTAPIAPPAVQGPGIPQ